MFLVYVIDFIIKFIFMNHLEINRYSFHGSLKIFIWIFGQGYLKLLGFRWKLLGF